MEKFEKDDPRKIEWPTGQEGQKATLTPDIFEKGGKIIIQGAFENIDVEDVQLKTSSDIKTLEISLFRATDSATPVGRVKIELAKPILVEEAEVGVKNNQIEIIAPIKA